MSEVATHPLDRVGVDVGRRHLDRGRQVDDDLPVRRGLEDLDDLVADVDRELEFGARVRLGRVLVIDPRLGDLLLVLAAQPRALERDVDDPLLVGAEHDFALQHARRVVEVDDRLLRSRDGLVRARDQMLARLGQDLDRDVVGDRTLVDQVTDEIEVGLGCRGESDLDLLVSHLHEQIEHDALALGAHRVDQGLVAVAQVDRAPARRLGDAGVRPRAVRQRDADLLVVRAVLVDRRAGGLLGVFHDGWLLSSDEAGQVSHQRRAPRRGRP